MSRYSDDFYSSGHPAESLDAGLSRSPLGSGVSGVKPRNPNIVQNGLDQDYYDLIAQYQDKPYYKDLLNNPFLRSKNDPYVPNMMNEIAGALGFSDGSEAYYAKLKSDRNQYLADMLDQFRQQEYNEPINEVQRLAAAGINSDLAPGSVDPGKAAENDQPIIDAPGFGDFDSGLASVASLFTQIYSFASGIAKDAMTMQSLQLDNAGKEFDLTGKLPNLAKDYISSHIQVPYKDKSGKWTFPDLVLEDLEDFAKTHFSSRSTRRRFVKEVENSYKSASGFISRFSDYKTAEDVRGAFVKSLSSNLSSGYTASRNPDIEPMVILTQTLTDIQRDLEKLKVEYEHDDFQFRKNKVKHDQAVLDKLKPESEAAAINSGHAASSMHSWRTYYEDKTQKIIQKNVSDAAERLNKAGEKNGLSPAAQATEFGLRLVSSEDVLHDIANSVKYKGKKRTGRDKNGNFYVARDKRF